MSRKYTINEVREFFRQRDCVLLAETYENNKQKLEYKCSCGEISEIRFDQFRRGQSCAKCAVKKIVEKRKHSFSFVKSYFEEHNCVLLSDNYKNNHTNLEYLCSCGNTHISTFDTFKKSHRCRECWKRSLLGQTNPNYNPTLTDEYREFKRVSMQYSQWRNDVFKRDNFCCVKCGISGVYVQAHHLDGFHWCVEKRYEVDNGATLCVSCHDQFHAEYGRHNNTKAQFDEWVRRRNDKVV